ncbi:unnamed protein product [Euphydryas editha]|uniref:Reverse transcriptase domain-containing protein n=1 Tax=Euphydryas editha TaxID=104508 RepID=A0AAU9UPA6_EUPED|nr:unnamed protein product [Euphydryas editha]
MYRNIRVPSTDVAQNAHNIEQTTIQSQEQSITQIQTVHDPLPNNTQHTSTERAKEIDQLTRNIVVNEDQEPIVLHFLQTLAETKDISIEERLLLPKAKINKSFIKNVNTLNKYLPNILVTNNSLREINNILYAAAKTLVLDNNQTPYAPKMTINSKRNPPWKKRIQIRIEKLRKELGQLIEIEKGINTNRMSKIRDKLYAKYNIQSENDHNNTAEIIKQRIKALAGRIKRYEEMNTKKEQNKLFAENEHRLYRSLGCNATKDIKIPSKQNVEEFWKSILSNPQQYNKEANWIKEIATMSNEVNTIESEEITEDQVKFALRRMLNWKSPGLDKIHNYYIKYLTSVHKYLASLFTNIVSGKEPLEEWFTTGKVILVPKNENTEDPKNWRPIACLPSMYKLLTSVLANVLYSHCQENNIIAVEQRGCRRGARGCKDHLMVNKAILEDAHQNQRNLSMAWIDYQKAFDSVSHDWLIKVLDVYKCPSIIKRFLLMVMPSWPVSMTARGSQHSITTEPIHVRRGIFQGDSLSPLLFCLAVNPLSFILNRYEMKGYKLKDSFWINHLLYMDDLKIYANNKYNLKVLLDSIEIFTNDIGMSFGLNKCNILHITAGHRSSTTGEDHILLNGNEFKQLAIGERYKYLGIHESGKIEHSVIRQQISKEYFKRIKKLLNTHLNSRNIIKGINTYAIPVLLYSFGIINYKSNDLKYLDIKTRKLLAIKKAHQQKAEVERLYLPITEGGRGLINIENIYKTHILKYKQYLKQENDHLIQAIVQHDTQNDKYSIIQEAQEIERELRLPQGNIYTDNEIKEAIKMKQNKAWRDKQLHGQFPKKVLDQANIDIELSFKWLKKQQIPPSIESSIFAIQDQAIKTRQHQRDILKEPVDGKCRLCASKDETTQHIISGCDKLAGTCYVKRHNNLVQYWCLAKKHKIEVSDLWWKETLIQPQVKENDSTKILWEMPVHTDVTVTHNRPDLIYVDKINNKTFLIDITVPSDYNIGAKEIEKLSKYHLLKTEVSRLWNTQTTITPIVIGATGIVAKSIKKHIDKLSTKIDLTILQKQAAIHTSTILSKVLGDNVFVHDTQDSLIHNAQHSSNTQHSLSIQQLVSTQSSTITQQLSSSIHQLSSTQVAPTNITHLSDTIQTSTIHQEHRTRGRGRRNRIKR